MRMRVGLEPMAKVPGKATKGGLTPEQSARVREAIKERLLPKFENPSALAVALDAEQSTIWRFLNKEGGTSINVAARAADLLGEDLYDLLGLKRGPRLVDPNDDQPNRPKALAILREIGVRPRALELLRQHAGAQSDQPMDLIFLIELGLLYNREGSRAGTPLPENDDDRAPVSLRLVPPPPPPKPPKAPKPAK